MRSSEVNSVLKLIVLDLEELKVLLLVFFEIAEFIIVRVFPKNDAFLAVIPF
jgi:hypothetical protein